ncbi:hypothetical protein [Paenibacillus glycanilyticus]|uniref:hypothetical protein n=1 Tax=Paenibacillus glycanilyticus TaxID=126569 RepID=UPI00190FFB08|nr:hypothetical protein [Paenibacillus glycanilyticus]
MLAWLLSPIQSAEASKDNKVKVEDVVSMQVVGGIHGTKPSPMYKNNNAIGKEVITKVTDWINSSIPIGVQPVYGRHGYPRILKIQLTTKESLYVEVGYICVTSNTPPPGVLTPKGETYIFKSCSELKDEIVIGNSTSSLRAKSPELYKWLKMWELKVNK